MAVPLRNAVYERVSGGTGGSMTDAELAKALAKDGRVVAPDRFNKTLLDMEILGLVRVSWLSKDTRRIEVVPDEPPGGGEDGGREDDDDDKRDYEASFPGA